MVASRMSISISLVLLIFTNMAIADTPKVIIESPKQGDTLIKGSTFRLAWKSSGASARLSWNSSDTQNRPWKFILYRDGEIGKELQLTPKAAYYNSDNWHTFWEVPLGLTSGSNYRLKVYDVKVNVWDISPKFRIISKEEEEKERKELKQSSGTKSSTSKPSSDSVVKKIGQWFLDGGILGHRK